MSFQFTVSNTKNTIYIVDLFCLIVGTFLPLLTFQTKNINQTSKLELIFSLFVLCIFTQLSSSLLTNKNYHRTTYSSKTLLFPNVSKKKKSMLICITKWPNIFVRRCTGVIEKKPLYFSSPNKTKQKYRHFIGPACVRVGMGGGGKRSHFLSCTYCFMPSNCFIGLKRETYWIYFAVIVWVI